MRFEATAVLGGEPLRQIGVDEVVGSGFEALLEAVVDEGPLLHLGLLVRCEPTQQVFHEHPFFLGPGRCGGHRPPSPSS